jgi:hypothetical protein
MPSQIHHFVEPIIVPGEAKRPLPILFSGLASSDVASQLGEPVFQCFHTFFKRCDMPER